MPTTNQDPRPDWVMPPTAEQGQAPAPARRPARLASTAATAALVVIALLVGAGVSLALAHRPAAGAAAANQAPAGGFQGGPQGGQQGGPPGGFQGGPGGGLAGEQHVQGTVTATTATTVTVKSSSGTATYTVDGSSQVVRDGQAATLAAVKAGDPVFVHVYPSGGKLLVERLFAGSSASGGPGGGFAPPGAGRTT